MPVDHAIEPDGSSAPATSMVNRMTRVLDAFHTQPERLGLDEVIRRTRLPRSTAHRILEQMTDLGWIDHGSHGYTLGPRALRLARLQGGNGQLRESTAPILQDLHVRTGLVAHLCTLSGSEIVFLDKIGGSFAQGLPSDVGTRWWVTNSCIGKAILAALSPEDADAVLQGCPEFHARDQQELQGRTRTIHLELNRIRTRRGIAVERGEGMPNVGAVACAVSTGDRLHGAISVCGDLRTMNFPHLAPLVAAAARRAAGRLAGTDDASEEQEPVTRCRYKDLMYPAAQAAPGWWWSPERYTMSCDHPCICR